MSTAGWRVPINVKLIAILAVPVVGYVVTATAAVAQAQQTANRARDQASVVKTAVGPTSLTTSLIDERTITELESAGLEDDLTLRIGNSTEARRATDAQLSALQGLLDDDPDAEATYGPAVAQVTEGLDALRAEVDAGSGDPTEQFSTYGTYIRDLMDANAVAVERVDDAEFWQGAMLSELATRQKDARAVLIDALIPVGLNQDGLDTTQQTAEIGRALSIYEKRDAAIQELATGPYARAGSVLVEALQAADLAKLARNTLDTGALDSTELFDVASYKGGFVYDAPSGDYIHDNFRASVVEVIEQNATSRTAAATRALRLYLILGSLGFGVTVAIAFVVARSITRPLRALTEQTIDTANVRLPETLRGILDTPLGEDVAWPDLEPISVSSNDEVADVANALNTMQQSALDLAVEEALLRRLVTDSLVTLGQRNQALLDRQLDFITDMERGETDPDTLADLFHLDHLAIRMRRNAESLLVLAGVDPPRMWVGPTSIGVTIRAALGEAEDYKRIKVQDVEPATVAGSATAELSHLLAELIENALRFSPRNKNVVVRGHHSRPGEGNDGGYVVTVSDTGVGMSRSEIERANRRLADVESYTMAPSRHMGHYVTGRLATRHGVAVSLGSNAPRKGITATINLPPGILTSEEPADPETRMPSLPPTQPMAEIPYDDDDYDEYDDDLVPDIPTPEAPAAGGEGLDPEFDAEFVAEVELHPEVEDEDETRPVPELRLLPQPLDEPTGPKKPRKRKLRPIADSKLPVPPPATEPLVIQPLEAPSDGQAS